VKKTATNFKVTLTDLFGKTLFSCTSFSSLQKNPGNKKRRLSFFALEDIVTKFAGWAYFYNITMIIIISRIRSKSVFSSFYRKLKLYGLKVYGRLREFVNPHNGVRGRKIRRR
jgi:ribosomal protein S11